MALNLKATKNDWCLEALNAEAERNKTYYELCDNYGCGKYYVELAAPPAGASQAAVQLGQIPNNITNSLSQVGSGLQNLSGALREQSQIAQSTAAQPVIVERPVDRPVLIRPADRPVMQQSVVDRPVMQQSVVDRPVLIRPADRPVMQQQNAQQAQNNNGQQAQNNNGQQAQGGLQGMINRITSALRPNGAQSMNAQSANAQSMNVQSMNAQPDVRVRMVGPSTSAAPILVPAQSTRRVPPAMASGQNIPTILRPEQTNNGQLRIVQPNNGQLNNGQPKIVQSEIVPITREDKQVLQQQPQEQKAIDKVAEKAIAEQLEKDRDAKVEDKEYEALKKKWDQGKLKSEIKQYVKEKSNSDYKTYCKIRKFLDWYQSDNRSENYPLYYAWKIYNWDKPYENNSLYEDYIAWKDAVDFDDYYVMQRWKEWKKSKDNYKKRYGKQLPREPKHGRNNYHQDKDYQRQKRDTNVKSFAKFKRYVDWANYCEYNGYDTYDPMQYAAWLSQNNPNYLPSRFEKQYQEWQNTDSWGDYQLWYDWNNWRKCRGVTQQLRRDYGDDYYDNDYSRDDHRGGYRRRDHKDDNYRRNRDGGHRGEGHKDGGRKDGYKDGGGRGGGKGRGGKNYIEHKGVKDEESSCPDSTTTIVTPRVKHEEISSCPESSETESSSSTKTAGHRYGRYRRRPHHGYQRRKN